MSTVRSSVIIATVGYSLCGVPRLLGIMTVKPEIAMIVQVADLAVLAAMLTALVWPWLILPWRCTHDRIYVLRCNMDVANKHYPGKRPMWVDKHGVGNFARCAKCEQVLDGSKNSNHEKIYGEKEDRND